MRTIAQQEAPRHKGAQCRSILLVLALFALSSRADPILARDGGRLVLLPTDATEVTYANLPPVLAWERTGGKSFVRIIRTGDDLLITANLDAIGPGWVYAEICVNDCGICVTTRDNVSNYESNEQVDGIDDLSLDSRTVLQGIVAHVGQRGLPDVRVLAALRQSVPPSASARGRLAGILSRMDADACAVRCAAQRELERDGECLRLAMAMEMDGEGLTLEQAARVRAALAVYR